MSSISKVLEGLSPEQILPVKHDLGSAELVIAGAGSGKTRVMTARVKWLISEGVPERRIVAITFTNKAADELRHRLGYGNDPKVGPRVSTIHSLALNAIRMNPEGFGLKPRLSTLDSSDQKDLIRRMVEGRKKDPRVEDINIYRIVEKIEYHRARGVGFTDDYTPEVHKAAQLAYKGYHALSEIELLLWKDYEKAKQEASVVDFSDMLHLVVRRGKTDQRWREGVQRQFVTALVDESQDTNSVQWEFIELLLHPDNMNLCAVGDLSQCQPPGTRVKVVVQPPRGSLSAICEERNIEDLRDGDAVVAWSKHVQITYSAGRKIHVASRPYQGELLRITTEAGGTECTPNHWNWVRFNRTTEGKYLVYLMHRSDLGFRVGISVFKRATAGGKKGAYGLSYRTNQEKADRAWILRVCETRAEAEAWEEIYSVKYGIPESLFEPTPCLNKTMDLIRLVFSHANPEGGHRCLTDHGLLFDYPIIQGDRTGGQGESWRGWFKTASANIIPQIMDIPVEGRNLSTPILGVTRRHYDGLVYSLDVEKDHTYIADGLVVGNSIYGFNGAAPEILGGMVENWRGARPALYKLEDNYRSLEKIVRFSNKIQSTMTGTVPLTMKWKRTAEHTGRVTTIRAATSREIAERIAENIYRDHVNKTGEFKFKDNAILVRSASQISDIETALVRQRIPYVIRGGQGLFQTEEARDLFAYMKLIVNPHDVVAFLRAVGTPSRGIGPMATDKLQREAIAKHGGDMVAAAAASEHMKLRPFGEFLANLREVQDPVLILNKVIKYIDYPGIIRDSYKKKPEVVETKLANLTRIQDAIQGLQANDPSASPADIIFRITLDQKAEAEKEAVVISTIHSAKGLEWPRVFVTNLVEGSLPHQWSQTDKEVEEERRLFYVAVTRAEVALSLCIPSMVFRGPNAQSVSPSRFLADLGL